ncbi:MAG: ABC transporter permease [Saprospiraceae bacterium]
MLTNYLKIAFRSLNKHRSYAALNIVGLGLSIACCVLIFMLVRHHLTFDNFHKKGERIAVIGTESRLETVTKENNVPYPMGAALRQEFSFLEKTAMLSARYNSLITLEKPGSAPVKFQEENARAFAEPELFEFFDFPLLQGSFDAFKQPNTAILTEKLAEKYYGSTSAAMGGTFKVNNNLEYRIVGVLRNFPTNTDLGEHSLFTSWATLVADSNSVRALRNWGGIHGGTRCFVLFREGHSAAELEAVFPKFRDKYFHPEVREWWYHALPLQQAHFDPDYGFGTNKKQIFALALIGLFLLLTACVNFVNMATAQALGRAREVGVRKTMGSTRPQIFWQFMAETGVIVTFSTAIGLLMARIGLPFLNELAGTELSFQFGQDLALYGFLAVLMVVSAFLAGAYPGVALSGFRAVESLKGTPVSGVGGAKKSGLSLRRLLVGTQFAISQALIIAAVVVTAQTEYAHKADLGFRQEGIVTVTLPAPEDEKKTNLKHQLERLPGVQKISLCFQPPASDDNWNTSLQLQGRSKPEPWPVNYKFVDTAYLGIFEMPLVAGRNLQASDTTREYLVNEEVAHKLGFADPRDLVGKMLDVDHTVLPIVGVVKNFHNQSFHEGIMPQVMTTAKPMYSVAAIQIHMPNAPEALAGIEKVWSGIYPEYVFERTFIDERIATFYERETVILALVRLFACIAVFIGCLGLYGLAAFMVNRKSKEIGIRKTLGASIAGIIWLFGREYVRLIIVAFCVAVPLTWWGMNGWLQGYAYRITIGAGIFALSLLATFILAAASVGVQSIRAALADPVRSLRSE